MITEQLAAWQGIVREMAQDQTLLARATAENEWFTPTMLAAALTEVLPWLDAQALAHLRAAYPPVQAPAHVGLILAGNLPLVGLHDVLMTLLAGHHAIVKPSHKDRVLLAHLLAQSPPEVQARCQLVDSLAHERLDFLIATGSGLTARTLAEEYAAVPKLLRANRYSVAVLDGTEMDSQLEALADDVLRYHGMGCRSVSAVAVPQGYDLHALAVAMEKRWKTADFAAAWQEVLRHERALQRTLGLETVACAHVIFERAAELRPGRIGVLSVVEYADLGALQAALATEAEALQCVVGVGGLAFGQAQCPGLDDWADGVDTLGALCAVTSR